MPEHRRTPPGITAEAQIRAHPAFLPLVNQRRALAWSLAALMLAIYFGFIALVAFAPATMAIPVAGTITLGFPLGLGVIIAAILLTGLYVLRANASFDGMTRHIVEDAP
jgi:uncharacterized membrane protein (DUF485 family)